MPRILQARANKTHWQPWRLRRRPSRRALGDLLRHRRGQALALLACLCASPCLAQETAAPRRECRDSREPEPRSSARPDGALAGAGTEAGLRCPESHATAVAPAAGAAFYFGGHAGYSRGHGSDTLFAPDPRSSSNAFSSTYGGIQIGYRYLLASRFLLGVESDLSAPSFLEDGVVSTRTTSETTVTDEIDYIGTLRGRLGWVFDRWLLYGTGGLAWSQARLLESPDLGGDTDERLHTRTGWTLGFGADLALTPDWTARLEYLYDRFGSVTAVFPSGTRYSSAFDVHALRLALNRELRWPHADAASSAPGDAPTAAPVNWNIHGQFTYVEQGYPAFRSPYEGQQSLAGASQWKNTASATGFLGFRLWDAYELYVDPELMQGFGLSNTYGVAGFPNGEAQKSSFPMPRFNVARLFLRRTFGFGGEQETIEDGPNQVAGKQDVSRLTVTVGKLAVIDIFDQNVFANDPRANFLNWNIYGAGAYDWTMDKISWTWGAVTELNQPQWAGRIGYFLVPTSSNVNTFDVHIPDRGEYAAELELRRSLFSQPNRLRVFGWVNRAVAGSYADAVALAVTSPNYPDITLTREVRTNYGLVVNAEQEITKDVGLFSRASWDRGLTEKIGGTDCDASLSLGASLSGGPWRRPEDRVGVGGVVDALSPEARAYFAAGGLGILIGDGRLNYRQEKILESYYAYSLDRWLTLTADYQFIANPAYNADRGPVSVFAGRLHAEF
jgi:high affinity Mn2+ porin